MANYIATTFATMVARSKCTWGVRARDRRATREMVTWCESADRAGAFWLKMDGEFFFSNADTAIEFRLRWS